MDARRDGRTPSRLISRRQSESVVFDDGTNTFFWRGHTILALVCIVAILSFIVFTEEESEDVKYNAKRGIIAGILMFLAIGVTQVKDGPFTRPHPIFWRFLFCASILYELGILFILFQSADQARFFLTYLDPSLNQPLDFRAYGGNCTVWDPGHKDGPLHNVMVYKYTCKYVAFNELKLPDKMDGFVTAHFLGWFLKALIFRDIWMTTVISATFELLEYTFEHQLPNFSECWWDHWILDFLVCNGLGIYLGLKCLKYLSVKEYKWIGLWHIQSYKGKMRRVVGQFSPYSWISFRWKPTENLYRWLLVSFQILMILLAELNTFYLKFVMWMPPDHPLVLTRLVFIGLWGGVAVREMYDFMNGVTDKFGQQAWMIVMIICTELLIVVKFGWDVITTPFPTYIKLFWIGAIVCYVLWTLWRFQMKFPRVKALIDESPNLNKPLRDYLLDTDDNSMDSDEDYKTSNGRVRKRKSKALETVME